MGQDDFRAESPGSRLPVGILEAEQRLAGSEARFLCLRTLGLLLLPPPHSTPANPL